MATLFDTGIFSAEDIDGSILVGAKLWWYAAGTSTPKNTYADIGLSVPNANPVVANASGRFPAMWLDTTGYKFILTTATGSVAAPLVTRDNIGISDPTTVSSIGALQALAGAGVIYLVLGARSGFFHWDASNLSAQVTSDPLQGIYIPPASDPTGASGAWVRDQNTPGIPEWFGARLNDSTFDSLAALDACHAVCPDMALSFGDYYIKNTFNQWRHNTSIVGSGPVVGGSAGNGSRIVLNGANVADKPVFIFGKATYAGGASTPANTMFNSKARNFSVVRDCTGATKVNPSTTADPINAVRGIQASYLSACFMEDVSSYDSPVGIFYTGCLNSTFTRTKAYRTTPASSATNDLWVGHLIGGYSINYGYIGANASIYLNGPQTFNTNAAFSLSLAMRIFGFCADTFVDNFETSGLQVGFEIDGRDAAGVTITDANGPFAHQDIRIGNPILDGCTITGYQVRNLNTSADVTIVEPYSGAGTTATENLRVYDINGKVRIVGGRLLAGAMSVFAANMGNFQLEGTYIFNAARPVVLSAVLMGNILPNIFSPTISAGSAVEIQGATGRCFVQPQIRAGGVGKFTNGVTMELACVVNEINITMIDVGGLVSGNPANKVRYNGADARGASGTNIITGVQV